MKDSFLDFFSSALVPVLLAYVTACSACYIHCCLVSVATIWASPDELVIVVFDNFNLTIISTLLAVVTLCIEFCIHDCVIDVFEKGKYSRDVILHVWYFYIRDCSTWRKLLEF